MCWAADSTKNFSGAEIEGLVKSATSFALNRQVDVNDLSKPIDEDNLKVLTGIFFPVSCALVSCQLCLPPCHTREVITTAAARLCGSQCLHQCESSAGAHVCMQSMPSGRWDGCFVTAE